MLSDLDSNLIKQTESRFRGQFTTNVYERTPFQCDLHQIFKWNGLAKKTFHIEMKSKIRMSCLISIFSGIDHRAYLAERLWSLRRIIAGSVLLSPFCFCKKTSHLFNSKFVITNHSSPTRKITYKLPAAQRYKGFAKLGDPF